MNIKYVAICTLFVLALSGTVVAVMQNDGSDAAVDDIAGNTPPRDKCGENLEWIFDSDTGILTISGTGRMYDWKNNADVPWYSHANKIKSVTVGNDVSSIGNRAFMKCAELESVQFGGSIGSIGSYAFSKCVKLTAELKIPDTVSGIGSYAFNECSGLNSVIIGGSVSVIGEGAFKNCTGLTSVAIGKSVVTIETDVFYGCAGLGSIDVSPGNANYSSDNGVLFDKGMTELIQYPAGKPGGFVIPDFVTDIRERAFENCTALQSVTIPETVRNIGSNAFCGCTGIRELIIPISTNAAREYLFYGCGNVEKVVFTKGTGTGCDYSSEPTSDRYYKNTPWYISREKLSEVILDDGISRIGDYMFMGCGGLTAANMPDSLTDIGIYSFGGCAITSVTLPASTENIDLYAFSDCNELTSFDVDPGNANFSSDCGILLDKNRTVLILCPPGKTGSYDIPATVKTIGTYAAWGCGKLTSVTLPDSLERIEKYAFYGCGGLTGELVIPRSVTHIGDYAFGHCGGLTGGLVLPDSLETVEYLAFGHCGGFEFLVIPDSVKHIGSCAFLGCDGLTSVVIGESVTDIEEGAFDGCPNLTELTIPVSVNTGVSAGAFKNCTKIEKIVFTKGTGTGCVYSASEGGPNWYGNTPWYLSKSVLSTLVIADGITYLDSVMFTGFVFRDSDGITELKTDADSLSGKEFKAVGGTMTAVDKTGVPQNYGTLMLAIGAVSAIVSIAAIAVCRRNARA